MRDDVSRRRFLETGALAATLGLTTTLDDVDESIDESTTQIPAPFDELPTVEAPTETERKRARRRFGPRAAPAHGPVVDPNHKRRYETPLWLPEWVLEAARWRVQRCADAGVVDRVDRGLVADWLLEYAQADEVFLTPDGRDAVDVILDEIRDGEDA